MATRSREWLEYVGFDGPAIRCGVQHETPRTAVGAAAAGRARVQDPRRGAVFDRTPMAVTEDDCGCVPSLLAQAPVPTARLHTVAVHDPETAARQIDECRFLELIECCPVRGRPVPWRIVIAADGTTRAPAAASVSRMSAAPMSPACTTTWQACAISATRGSSHPWVSAIRATRTVPVILRGCQVFARAMIVTCPRGRRWQM